MVLPNMVKKKERVKLLSCVQLFATPWAAAHQAPPSMGFSRQEYWSGLPLPSLPDMVNMVQLFESVQPLLQKGHMKNLLICFIYLVEAFIPLPAESLPP